MNLRAPFGRLPIFALGLALGTLLAPLLASNPVSPAIPPAAAEGPANNTALPLGTYAAEILRVLDGDTFEARVHLWPGLDVTTKVRLRGIDAPEMRARCPEERAKADAARDALTAILADGNVAVAQVGLDKYGGRVLATASTRRTPDVSAAMLARGFARAYFGGRREPWCPGS